MLLSELFTIRFAAIYCYNVISFVFDNTHLEVHQIQWWFKVLLTLLCVRTVYWSDFCILEFEISRIECIHQ